MCVCVYMCIYIYIHTMFLTALLTIVKTWRQPKCPSTDE